LEGKTSSKIRKQRKNAEAKEEKGEKEKWS